jgi:pyridoxine 5-phosphate synthase
MAATGEMIEIAVRTKPDAVSLVPESPNEVTTEGGLDVIGNFENLKSAVEKLKAAGIFVSIFIDPDLEQITAAERTGAQQVELCTAEYAELTLQSSPPYEGGVAAPAFDGADGVVLSPAKHMSTETKNHPPAPAVPLLRKEGSPEPIDAELSRIAGAAVHAHSLGLKVAAGHGLTYRNVAALARIDDITEFNIGHNIISRAVFVGLDQAVKEMIGAIAV